MNKKRLDRKNSAEVVAVIGTGRSGTHMLGKLIDTSKKVTSPIKDRDTEDKELFPLIVETVTQNRKENAAEIAGILQKRVAGCPTDVYLEKSHPLLWLANDSALSELPIKYIGITRDPYATVASMLEHKGVRKWCEEWDKLPQPNIFLGTNKLNIEHYEEMSLAQKCTMRWVSHTKELLRLTYLLPEDKYLLINYEDLLASPKEHIRKIERFIGVKDMNKKYQLSQDSLDKWRNNLTPSQVREIGEVINYYYDGS